MIGRLKFSLGTLGVGVAVFCIGATMADERSIPEHAAITKTSLDYIEGWYAGDAARMEQALYPELAKRVLVPDPRTGKGRIDHMSAMRLVQRTRARSEKAVELTEDQREVVILDVFENAASVKVVGPDWVDYLHLSKLGGRWQIVNVLWEFNPATKERLGIPAEL